MTADPVFSDGSAPAEAAPAEPVTGGTYGPGGASYSQDQIVDIIYEAADNYGQSREVMLRVARCESGLNPSAVGGGGTYHGLFQFVPSTFAGTPYGEYDIYVPGPTPMPRDGCGLKGKRAIGYASRQSRESVSQLVAKLPTRTTLSPTPALPALTPNFPQKNTHPQPLSLRTGRGALVLG